MLTALNRKNSGVDSLDSVEPEKTAALTRWTGKIAALTVTGKIVEPEK